MKKVLAPLVVAVLVFTGCNTQSSKSTGKDGKELKLTTPKTVNVDQDGTADLKVTIDRKGFDDAVAVKFDKLPEGVTIEGGNLDKGVKEKTFTVKAANTAKVGKHTINADATFGDMKDHHEITIEVKEKKASTSKSSPVGEQAAAELKQKRDELNTATQARMKDIDQSMADLRTQAKSADAKSKVEINKRLTTLDEQRKKLGEQVGQIQTTSAEAWQDFSTRLTNAANDLHQGASDAVKQFKKK